MLNWLKWVALLLFAVAVLAAVILAATGKYDVEINAKDLTISLKSTHKPMGGIGGLPDPKLADPKLAELVMRKLGKTNLINVSRAATYSLQAIEQDSIVVNARHEMELSNRGDTTVEEDLEIGLSEHAPKPEVLVDNVLLNAIEVETAPGQVMRVYRVTLAPGQTKKAIYTYRGLKWSSLPYTHVDVITRPTLRSELILEGAPALLRWLRC